MTELCTDGIPPTRFLDAFPSPRRLGSYDNLSFFPEEAVNDDLLRCLARNGIWRNDLINEYRLNYITEDGIIDYCFGDYPPNIGKRELSVYGPSHSERLLEKLVQVSICIRIEGSVPLLLGNRNLALPRRPESSGFGRSLAFVSFICL